MISLSAKGLTHGEICAHLAEIYGASVSKQAITTITDRVIEGMAEWQSCPLDSVYPVIFVDTVNETHFPFGEICGSPTVLIR